MPGYRIIGINHDDLADGSGKAGLTFETTNDVLYKHIWNDTKTNVGGWRSSKLRARLNSGDLWALLPAELQSKAKAVTKMTDNEGGGSAGTPTATNDKVFILSTTEIYGDLQLTAPSTSTMRRRGILDLRLCAISALVPCLRVTQRTLSMLTLSVAGAAVVPTVPATCFPLGASRFSSARPARLRAGLSFGKCTNGLGSRHRYSG